LISVFVAILASYTALDLAGRVATAKGRAAYLWMSRTAELSNSLRVANRELKQLALHDTLTGLPNRVLLADRIEQAMRTVQEHGGWFALIFMALDGFKPINDAFGHHMGDQLLREVALRLRNDMHGLNTLARIGGDEFVLLVKLPERDDASAYAAQQVLVLPAKIRRGDRSAISGWSTVLRARWCCNSWQKWALTCPSTILVPAIRA
jgi:diguanylate cyclase (GGDEF)-like protein